MRSPNSVVLAFLTLGAVLTSSACGQKGPLTLPVVATSATPAAAAGAASGAAR